jgi:phosphohistidine phosphatase
MTKILYLLRHAKAGLAEPGMQDIERPLNGRGREACGLVAAYLARAGLPDAVLCSTARRTRETLDRIAATLGWTPPATHSAHLYLAGPPTLLQAIRKGDGNRLLLVGHNPGIEELAGDLAGSGDREAMTRLHMKYPTAGLAVLSFAVDDWSKVVPRGGKLEAFVTPASLAAAPPRAKAAG